MTLGLAAFSGPVGAETLSCPSHWPEDPNAQLASSVLWAADGWEAKVEPANDDIVDFVANFPDAYYEVACTYHNGRRLYIPVPGQNHRCHIKFHIDYSHTKYPWPDYQTRKLWCTYQKTDDVSKDRIQIKEIEPISRQTDLYGVHLGMTEEEVKTAWASAGFISKDIGKSAVTPDGYSLALQYGDTDGRVTRLTVIPPANSGMAAYRPLHVRFGAPPGDHGYGLNDWRLCYFWDGTDNTRLEFEMPSYKGDVITEIRLIDLR